MIHNLPENALVYGVFLVLICFFTPVNAEEDIHYEFVTSSRQIMRVGPNQTLDSLVQQIYAHQKPLWPQIKQKIEELNPSAFNRFTGQLIVGASLKLVTIKKIRNLKDVSHLVQVGTISSIKGYVVAIDKNGKDNTLQKNSLVYEGDRIKTSRDSTVAIEMIDGARMYLKPDSTVRITEYVMKSAFEKGSRSIINLIKGGLRKITGAIAANPLSIYRLHTGVMTIGVRGTDFVVKLCKDNDCQQSASCTSGDARLHVAVLDGVITMEDEEGAKGDLALGQYAIADWEKVVMVDDQKPVAGLLTEEESKIFQKAKPPEEEKGFWPWLLGGALFGLGI
jgi:hypothetical protein